MYNVFFNIYLKIITVSDFSIVSGVSVSLGGGMKGEREPLTGCDQAPVRPQARGH